MSIDDVVGAVPLCVELCDDDNIAKPKPQPLYFLLPRSSLMLSIADKVREAFQNSVADFGSPPNLWLTVQGSALCWHYPCSVCVDAAVAKGASLPLTVTAHMSNSPLPPVVVPISSRRDQTLLAAQMYKQGCVTQYTTVKGFMNLAPAHFSAFCEFPLRTEPSPSPVFAEALRALHMSATNTEVINVPLVLHDLQNETVLCTSVKYATRLTLGGCLASVLGLPVDVLEACNDQSALQMHAKREAVLHGLRPSLATPMSWILDNLGVSDLRVHIVLAPTS